MADLSDCSVRRGIPDYQEGGGVDKGRTAVCSGDVRSGGDNHLGPGKFFDGMLDRRRRELGQQQDYSIGVGGAYGIVMMLNVWGIIWPNNKRIIAATAGTGPAAPPELARQAFLASRTNAWLSLPLLLFMGTSHGDWVIFGKN